MWRRGGGVGCRAPWWWCGGLCACACVRRRCVCVRARAAAAAASAARAHVAVAAARRKGTSDRHCVYVSLQARQPHGRRKKAQGRQASDEGEGNLSRPSALDPPPLAGRVCACVETPRAWRVSSTCSAESSSVPMRTSEQQKKRAPRDAPAALRARRDAPVARARAGWVRLLV